MLTFLDFLFILLNKIEVYLKEKKCNTVRVLQICEKP